MAKGLKETDIPGLTADFARQSIEKTGSSIFEFKVGRYSLECDIATVHAVREALGPGINIAVDANMAYSIDQGRQPRDLTYKRLMRLRILPISWAEQRKSLGFPG
ncbi:MAG: hypothetical protein IID51_09620 [Proteobacteria bacterium]|nr:hypothetical protein [Pseudomonadota bacterium]